ncbi:hypothetical protein PZ938_11295 [Luteipulveratus sp. YIM 133132]|uniref:hypothetical protein n=1 Tax=Luteipulveratus flavus TaxID=3031728 RepID=UPI0023AFE71A|nr:hypothetical protein [Luteipulveratus sp. YIM 133132]MDE9366192.1 hypothetical protein [Luteipulveratus sp. YIM 133132]
MSARRDATLLFAGYALSELAFRFAQIALPLVVLRTTGSVAATGLVGGASGIPALLSPWWARGLRQRIASGRGLALTQVAEAAALAMVPLLAWAHLMNVVTLAAAGLALGSAQTLSAPGLMALFADVGDRLGPGRAVTLLTWQDGVRRTTMLLGPAIGGVAVALDWTLQALWFESLTLLLSALLALPVRGSCLDDVGQAAAAPAIRDVLVGRADIARGWVMRGTSCLTWFAFTIGTSVIGADRGRPGLYFAAGMTGYGVGSLAGTAVASAVVRRYAPMTVARAAWVVGGLAWIGMAAWTTPVGVAVCAGIGGGFVVVGIAAVNRAITDAGAGPVRRALMGGQSVVVNATSSAGLLAGAPLIGVIGARPTLVGTGVLTALAALAGPRLRLRRLEPADGAPLVPDVGRPEAALPSRT